MLLPTRIDVMYCPGCRSKTFATKSSRLLCLRSISSLRRFCSRRRSPCPKRRPRGAASRGSDNGYGHRYASVCGSFVCGERAAGAGSPLSGVFRSGFHRGRQPPIRRQVFARLGGSFMFGCGRLPFLTVSAGLPSAAGFETIAAASDPAAGFSPALQAPARVRQRSVPSRPSRQGRVRPQRQAQVRNRQAGGSRTAASFRRPAGLPLSAASGFGRFVVLLAHIDIHFPREAAETPLLEGFVRLEALALKDVAAFVLDDLRIDVRTDALRLGIPEELL